MDLALGNVNHTERGFQWGARAQVMWWGIIFLCFLSSSNSLCLGQFEEIDFLKKYFLGIETFNWEGEPKSFLCSDFITTTPSGATLSLVDKTMGINSRSVVCAVNGTFHHKACKGSCTIGIFPACFVELVILWQFCLSLKSQWTNDFAPGVLGSPGSHTAGLAPIVGILELMPHRQERAQSFALFGLQWT